MATARQWFDGARPRTLPAAFAPVIAGTAVGVFERGGTLVLTRALLALVVALALQVGVNYSNDYSDGIRGTDNARVGPVRLVGQALAAPAQVKTAALLSFLVAAVAGLALVLLTQAWWLLAVGALAIAAAWFYTGGPRPYGYAGLGEVFVFVFFGLVATMGSAFVQTGSLTVLALAAAIGIGVITVAILVANNLRDIPGDTDAGKRTLAVRLGAQATRSLYVALIVVSALAAIAVGALSSWWALVTMLAVAVAIAPVRLVRSGAVGRDLIPVLVGTGRYELVYAVLMAAGLAIGTLTVAS